MSITANFRRRRRNSSAPVPSGAREIAALPVALEVAVILPCHNYGRFLEEALLSILKQSSAPAEIIVVDDSSTDETEQIARAYAVHGVRYLRVEVRSAHEARRAGFHATSSPLVCCLDADDQLSYDYLRQAVALFADPQVGIVWSPLQQFGLSTRMWSPLAGDIEAGNFIHSAAVFRREAAVESQAFEFPNEAMKEDWMLWRRILKSGKWKVARNPVVHLYRKHTSSETYRVLPERVDKVIVTTYLTQRPDPQTGNPVKPNCWEKICKWVLSVHKHGQRGVILHDSLSAEIIARIAPYNVQAVKVESCPSDTHNLAWRWKLYHDWLATEKPVTAWLTDLFDVHLNDDPSNFFRTDYDLWISKQPTSMDDGSPSDRWMQKRFVKLYGTIPDEVRGQVILNAGVLGGFLKPLLQLTAQMWADLYRPGAVRDEDAADMAALNKIIYCDWDLARVWRKGANLHSEFKAYDVNAPVAFVHK
jgi:glycosyltransferase involved in cell wall biosynthesis